MIILVSKSVISTGHKIADWGLGIFSVLGILAGSYLIYENKKTARVAPDSPYSGSADEWNINNELLILKEMLRVKLEILNLDKESDQQKLIEGYNTIINSTIINSTFESSLLNMKKLEDNEYLEQYTKYKNNLINHLDFIQRWPKNENKKKILKELINDNIYKDTINKYNTEIDENKNNINQLFNHFINYFIEMFDKEPYNLETLADNLIKNLQKLQTVILSMKDNISYKIQFNTLIKQACNNSKLIYPYDLKTRLTALKIDYETLIGKGEVSGKGDSKIMQCLNLIKSKLIPIDELDTLKTRSYNNLINITNDYYIHKKIDWHKYVTNIKPLFNKFEENEILNWIKTCIIPNNN